MPGLIWYNRLDLAGKELDITPEMLRNSYPLQQLLKTVGDRDIIRVPLTWFFQIDSNALRLSIEAVNEEGIYETVIEMTCSNLSQQLAYALEGIGLERICIVKDIGNDDKFSYTPGHGWWVWMKKPSK